MENKSERELAIEELKRIIGQSSRLPDAPRAIGGPFNLSPEEMLREVEAGTEIGRKIAEGFSKLGKQFPPGQ